MSVVIEDLKVDEAAGPRSEMPSSEGIQMSSAPPLDERMLREILAREIWRVERLMAD